ncbi:hypothetical protein P7K49_012858, partial [Saguinus oedipus]
SGTSAAQCLLLGEDRGQLCAAGPQGCVWVQGLLGAQLWAVTTPATVCRGDSRAR